MLTKQNDNVMSVLQCHLKARRGLGPYLSTFGFQLIWLRHHSATWSVQRREEMRVEECYHLRKPHINLYSGN